MTIITPSALPEVAPATVQAPFATVIAPPPATVVLLFPTSRPFSILSSSFPLSTVFAALLDLFPEFSKALESSYSP
ncbi:MAG: hypothetical protein H6767_04815 [Candidatus Peribacteria bacterium]|nr:MAG: hypothetical protein H6767_04815 [Candidatus Peribacteria bacterium]